MNAHVERFCEHGGVVRCGPVCVNSDADYDFAVAYKVENGVAVIKALVNAGPSKFSTSHARAIIAALKRADYPTCRWERKTPNGWRSFVPKEHIPHLSHAKKSDGKVDLDVLRKGVAHAFKQIEDGHYEIVDLGQETLPNGDEKLWIVRRG